MIIETHSTFDKNFAKRIKRNSKLVLKYQKRLSLFILNSNDPLLKDHSLTGKKKGLRAFSITGDVRIIYLKIKKDHYLFIDIGSHNQVYK